MEEAILISSSSSSMNNPDHHACSNKAVELERKGIRGQKDQALNCPRCSSTNTKFCYYNNYSLTQPRYFCKTCRRYWTEGGTLRNVPVGGGSRKNKRSTITTTPSSSSLIKTHLPDLNPPLLVSHFSSQNPRMIIHEPPTTTPHDLNLAFSLPQYYHGISHQFSSELPKFENVNNNCPPSSSSSASSTSSHLKTEITARGVSSFMPPAAPEDASSKGLFPSGFPLQELKVPHLSFSAHLHGVDHQQSISTAGRVLFPFGEVKQLPTTTGVGHDYNNSNGNGNKGQGNSSVPAAYWNNAMFGGGGGGGGSW